MGEKEHWVKIDGTLVKVDDQELPDTFVSKHKDNEPLINWITQEEGFLRKPTDLGDGKITLGSGLTDPKWHKQYRQKGNVWSQEDNRNAVKEEIEEREKRLSKFFPNWNKLPKESQEALLSYKYNYNFTSDNSPKLFDAAKYENYWDMAKEMDATSKISKFQNGLGDRRSRERQHFRSGVPIGRLMWDKDKSEGKVYSAHNILSKLFPQNYQVVQKEEGGSINEESAWDKLSLAEKAEMIGVAVKNGITTLPEIRAKYNEFAEGGSKKEVVEDNTNTFSKGGSIHIKPENRGKFTALKERTGHSATWFKEHGTPAQKKMATFALNAKHWKHAEGGNLFDGESEPTQLMQIMGKQRPFWEELAEYNRKKEEETQRNITALRQYKGKELAEKRQRDYLTTSNDNTWVENSLTHRQKNPHLSDRSIEGSKAYEEWAKAHPNLATWGTALGTIPFAIASYPFVAAGSSGLATLGDAAAATSAGQTITAGLAPFATAASTSVAGAPLYTWADVGLSSLFGGHGVQTAINEGGVSPITAIEIAPLGRLAKPAAEELQVAANWRPWVPRDANRYYRIVGESGDPIGDAIQSGVIRRPGANPNARANMEATMEDKPIRLATKAHSYPIFSKGKPWEGSTSRVDGKGKPIIIRSKLDTGPVKWEESNVDFSHKGHKGIFRPNYYGELNSTPTRYFEYWEPKRFGYMKREFPVDTNPYHNLMGKGYTVDRGTWMESDLGVEGEKFGEYIGSGGEQTVFQDVSNPSNVLKVYHDTYTKNPEGLQDLVNAYLRRNSIPLQQPASFTGYVKQDSYVYPVFNQGRLLPLGSMSNAEFNAKYLPLLQKSLKPYGYTGDGISSEFTNGINTLVDIKPENMGLTPTGELRFLDVDWVNR